MNDQNSVSLPDEEDILVTLEMDDGSTAECEILTIFEVNGQDYIALLPLEEEEQDEDEESVIYLYRYQEDEDGNPSLENIADEAEYEAVEERFDELLDEAEFDDD